MSHPDVLQCAVVGKADEIWGEAVSVMISAKEGTTLTLTDIKEHCEKILGRYKIPKYLIVTNDPLPQSGVGKILRREVRERFAAQDNES
jgi:long-chain acyl-CoA synthetase